MAARAKETRVYWHQYPKAVTRQSPEEVAGICPAMPVDTNETEDVAIATDYDIPLHQDRNLCEQQSHSPFPACNKIKLCFWLVGTRSIPVTQNGQCKVLVKMQKLVLKFNRAISTK